jgi:hypothetical protein
MSSKSTSPKISSASPKKSSPKSPKSASTSPKKSSASSSKKTSPEVKSILEAIDELGTDMKEEILDRLIPLKLNEFKSVQKPLNKDLDGYKNMSVADKQTYIAAIFEKNFEKFTTKNLPKEVNNVVSIIGDRTLDKISKNSPLNNRLNNIFKNVVKMQEAVETKFFFISTANLDKKEFLSDYEFAVNNRRKRNSPNYKKYKDKGKKYYEQYNKDFIQLWNSYNSAPDALPALQEQIIKHRQLIDNYDRETTEKDRPKIDAFLELNGNNTYAEYIRAIRNLPISVKKVVYYPPEEEIYVDRSKGKWAEGKYINGEYIID